MRITVMKFGGSSLAEPEKIKVMAERAVKARAGGVGVVMAVSAPADMTDDLLALSKLITTGADARERDVLLSTGETVSAALMAMAISGLGVKAVSLSGTQAGIRTDSVHGAARITAVDPARILRELKKGRIVVAAGFQGADKSGDITTLGRGGSDLTAVALARALKAGVCELYTDVQGIYTANPAIVPQAKKLRRISYTAMLELARSGAEVRQFQAIAYAAKYRIPLHLRSSFENGEGTRIGDFDHGGARPQVTCFSMKKTGRSAEICLIGSKLDAPGIKKTVKAAAAAGGHRLRKITCVPGKITLIAAFRDGDPLLKALHETFIPHAPRKSRIQTADRPKSSTKHTAA